MEKKLNHNFNNRIKNTGHQQERSTAFPSDDQYFIYDCLELDHKRSLPSFDYRWQIQTFPEAKKLIIENLKKELKQAERDIKESNRLEPLYEDIIFRKASPKSEQFWKDIVEVLFLNPLRIEQAKIIKRNTLLLSQLSGKSSTQNLAGVTQEEIQKAKEYPITDLLTISRGNTKCIFHNERTGSMHYYPKTNTCYCFGMCARMYDVIDIYRHLNNCSFVEAIRKLQ